MTLKNGFGKCSLLFFYQPKWMKRSKHRLFVLPQKNPNKEKALFEWPIVMQYDMKAKYQLISRTFLGMIFSLSFLDRGVPRRFVNPNPI